MQQQISALFPSLQSLKPSLSSSIHLQYITYVKTKKTRDIAQYKQTAINFEERTNIICGSRFLKPVLKP